jgi:pimeloyl-ACP methyl ester carboxylesterase
VARITINGIGIEYDLLGREGSPAVAITPGGRFAKDTAGLPELGEKLAARGKRVLLWDRPNCGLSDVSFDAPTESELQGRTLVDLIDALELGPTALVGGSAGSRVSMIAAALAPDRVSHLIMWWISGGTIGLMQLSAFYCGDAATRVGVGGMEAVLESPSWAEQAARNPGAREALMAIDPDEFVAILQRWAHAYIPSDASPVPGMKPEDFAALKMPVLLFRNGLRDVSHPRETSDRVHELIAQSRMIDPPWRDDEWNLNRGELARGQSKGLFVCWPQAADVVADFMEEQP